MPSTSSDYFASARESRKLSRARRRTAGGINSPPTDELFELDDIHTEVNEQAKLNVRTYRSSVEREVEADLRRDAKRRLSEARSEGEDMAIKNSPAQRPGRITPEQELELGEIIQKGVSLIKIQKELEASLSRPPKNKEWASAASTTSSQLRRAIASYREAKSTLVASNLGLVHAVVKKNKNYRAQRTYEELVQEGSLGLLRAAELFDPARGLRFSTYATIWIKGVLSNLQGNSLINIPARERTKWNKIRRAANAFNEERGREPNSEEVSRHAHTHMHTHERVSLTCRFAPLAASNPHRHGRRHP